MALDFAVIKQVSIVSVALRYGIHLTTKGQWANGVCKLPTHKQGDKGKNFSVNLQSNFWRCFSEKCNEANGGKKGGDVIAFVALMENCTEKAAAEKLVDWFNLDAGPAQRKSAPHMETRRDAVVPISETNTVKDFQNLTSPAGESKGRYMQEVDLWFDITFKRIEGESDDVFWKRIRNAVKSKLIESYRSGKAQVAA